MGAADREPMQRLIDALADDLVREYLTSEAAPGNDSSAVCSDRVLPAMSEAA